MTHISVINRFIRYGTNAFCLLFRLTALLALGMLLVFPAWKGIWAGYVAIVAGGVLLAFIIRGAPRLAPSITHLNEVFFVAFLVLFTTMMQFLLIVAFQSQPSLDGYFVYREAVALLETGRMNPLTYYPPAQIWYFALCFKVFGASPLMAQLCQIPLTMLVPVLVYLIGRRSCSVTTARWAAIGTALYPGLMFYILVTPYYSSLYVVFILLMVLSWLRVQADRPFWIPAFGGGVAAGCGALAKAVLLIAPAQTLLFLILTARSIVQRRLWVVWGVFTLAMMATIAPWILRNYQVFGRPVPVATSGPLVLYSANNPRSNGLYSSLPDETHVTTPAEMLSHGQWCREQAFRFIRSRPRDFASLVWRKLLHTWGTETTFVELINFKGQTLGKWDPALRAVVLTGWATLVLAWATTAVRAMYHRMPPAPLEIATGLLVLSKIIVYSLYEGGARHHLPAVPLLILLTAAMLMPDSGIHHGTTPPRPSIKHPESDLLPVRG